MIINSHYNKCILTVLSLIFIVSGCSKKEDQINFEIKTINEAVQYENNLGSKDAMNDQFTPIKGFYPQDSIYQIKGRRVFIRSDKNFLPLTTKYYKDANSDTIRYIMYEWNVAIPGTDKKNRETLLISEISKFDQYHNKYIELVQKFKKQFGEPFQGDGKVRKTLTIYPIWKAHLRFKTESKYIDLDWIWIPSNDARVFKILAKVYPKK